ncbi:Asp-tRNA(Asn)/Glu-tRNA(Gln) amidotransferase subunit GatB [Patescibacteria group bacterium]|nr:Asp-tRNA(Asn)/Glu-tRNA(Gln) amidotransferase subunit GatB [Patescibacteria group bacterium]
MNKYEPVIGLEIHVQLKTKSKMFCSCLNSGDDRPPNTTICPVCMGHPGVLPVTNKLAVKYAVMAALALDCKINKKSHFDRKSYYYPDLPKNYQISQYSLPFGHDGHLLFETKELKRRVRIERVHLEEDTGKLLHEGDKSASYVDYNRAGIPLMEVVTRPDIQTPAGARILLQELRLIMRYLEISDADMEKGQLRCDANVSLRPNPEYFLEKAKDASIGLDPKKLYPKTEVKNLNSFKSVEKALAYEIQRQTELWDKDQAPTQQATMGWDDKKGQTVLQRIKEEQHDYRYFPEPDLPPYEFDKKFLDSAKSEIVEMPYDRRKRFKIEYGLGDYDIDILVGDKKMAHFFEEMISELKAWLVALEQVEGSEEEIWAKHKKKLVKKAANWMISRLLGLLNEKKLGITDSKITPENFAELITLVYENKLNNQTAVAVMGKMFMTGKDPSNIMEEEDLGQLTDDKGLDAVIDSVISNNKKVVDEYKSGKEPALKFLIGQVMKQTKGRADAKKVEEVLKYKLK